MPWCVKKSGICVTVIMETSIHSHTLSVKHQCVTNLCSFFTHCMRHLMHLHPLSHIACHAPKTFLIRLCVALMLACGCTLLGSFLVRNTQCVTSMGVGEISHAMSEERAKFGHAWLFDTQCVRMDGCLCEICHANTTLSYIPWQRIQKLEIQVLCEGMEAII